MLFLAPSLLPTKLASTHCFLVDLIIIAYHFNLFQGLLEETEIYSFKLPCYTPFEEEVRMIIQEGSFNLDRLETF